MRSQQEAFDGVIRIHEQDPEAVEVCLKYIYGGGELHRLEVVWLLPV